MPDVDTSVPRDEHETVSQRVRYAPRGTQSATLEQFENYRRYNMRNRGLSQSTPNRRDLRNISEWFSTLCRHWPCHNDRLSNAFGHAMQSADPRVGWIEAMDALRSWLGGAG